MSKLFSTVAALVLFAVLGAPANAQSRPAWTQAGMTQSGHFGSYLCPFVQ